ncbi:MAG: nuclear transport factor 2 family protein [Cyanobacteria bacterium J06635_1]
MMTIEHPNISLLNRLDPGNLAGATDLFTEDFVWHFFNPKLPELQGDYSGVTGLQTFFEKLAVITNGTFQVEPLSATPVGDELVVVHVRDKMTFGGYPLELDAVVVWRIVGGLIAEAWDIPSVYTEYPQIAA